MAEIILDVRNLTTRLQLDRSVYPVVEDFTFQLEKGKTLAIVGESGCGKTMAALSILRILPSPPALFPTGEVLYKGKNLLDMPEKEMRSIRGSKIAMIFQNPMQALNPVFTIGDQMAEVAVQHLGVKIQEARTQMINSLREVNLPSPEILLKSYPHQLSGGMLQRVMIAMALICSPDILIADEPTTALDVTVQAQILTLLGQLQAKTGMGILLITHDLGVVAEMAHDVVVMYAAQKVEKGDALAIFNAPSHPYTQALFESRPDHAALCGKWPTIEGAVPSLGHFPDGCRFHPRCCYAFGFCKQGVVPEFSLPKKTGHEVKCWLFDKDLKFKLENE